MVEILGKPFLAIRLNNLRDQGFEKDIAFAGIPAGSCARLLGNGNRWGIK